MSDIFENKPIGLFFKRKNCFQKKIENLLQELDILTTEATMLKLIIPHIINKNLLLFDPLVGDWKCQTRASMVIDIFQEQNNLLINELTILLKKIESFCKQIKNIKEKIKSQSQIERQNFVKYLKQNTLYQFLEQNQLNLNLSNKLIFLSLCFITTEKNTILTNNIFNIISCNKLKNMLVSAKVNLCSFTIEYEKNLAAIYGSKDEQVLINNIKTNGFCSMTALFPGFKHILKKVSDKKQSTIIKLHNFCICGGFIKTSTESSTTKRNADSCLVFEAYQYPGSLEDLKNKLNIPSNDTYIKTEYYQKCLCKTKKINPINNSIDASLISIAQHPQFTTDNNIDWKNLNLIKSELHQQYERLKSIHGYSRNNMSNFFVYHIYPATIEQALQVDTNLEQTLESIPAKSIIPHKPEVEIQTTQTS